MQYLYIFCFILKHLDSTFLDFLNAGLETELALNNNYMRKWNKIWTNMMIEEKTDPQKPIGEIIITIIFFK